MDTSWKNNKKSLYGFLAMLATWAGLNILGIGGLINLVLGLVVFYLTYRHLDKKDKDNLENIK